MNTSSLMRVILMQAIMLSLCLALSTQLHSAESLTTFENEDQSVLYSKLLQEFRCLKCQNQNLADSHADLAKDLRNEIYQKVVAGQGQQEISDYLVARYGDFVLYRPPVKKVTYLLWFGPFILLLLAIIGAVKMIRAKPSSPTPAPSGALDDARRRLSD